MKLKDDHRDELYQFAKDLADRRVSFEEIENKLSSKTTDTVVISEIIKQIRKEQHSVYLKNGTVKILFGILFLVSGFIITCVNFHSNESFTVVMYSTSTIGLILVFWGLYDIIG
jgi:hypothetical protein